MTKYYKMSTSIKPRLRNQGIAGPTSAYTAAASPHGEAGELSRDSKCPSHSSCSCSPWWACPCRYKVAVRPLSSAPEEPCALASRSPRPLPQTHLLTSIPICVAAPGIPKHGPCVHLQLVFFKTQPDVKQ